jgi:hypothetical protein
MERAATGRSLTLDGASITALVEAAPMPGLLLDTDQIVLAVNESLLHWSGLTRALLCGRSSPRVPLAKREQFRRSVVEADTGGRNAYRRYDAWPRSRGRSEACADDERARAPFVCCLGGSLMRFSMVAAVAAVAAVALFALPVAAFASCTASVGAPAFSVAMKDLPVNYRVDLDSGALAKVANQNGMPGLKGEIPYGLTIGRYDLEVTVNTDSMRDGGGYCAQLRAAHVDIGLKQLDVVVDRRFAPGSCERQAVLDHEAQHVEVFREAVRYYLPALERALNRTTLPLNLHVADRNAARAAYLAPITDSLKPIFDAINGRARDGNARLDMPESYAAVFKRCSHW